MIFAVLKACVYLAMAYLLVVRACFFAICKAKGLLQLFLYLLDKSYKGKSRMSWQNRWEPRSSSQLQGQKMLSEGRVRRKHTHTLYILPAFMDVARHRCPLLILIPLFSLSFSFFLWIQPGFEATFDPSRFANLPTNLPASTSNFTIANCPKMIKYSFYKVSTMCSHRNGTMERD